MEAHGLDELLVHRDGHQQIYDFMSALGQTRAYLRPMLTDGSGYPDMDTCQTYQCTLCDRTFAKPISLKQHMQDRHGKALKALRW